MQAGKFPLETPKVFKEDDIRSGRGTPGKRKPSRDLRHRFNDQLMVDQARTSTFEALCQFRKKFRRSATPQVIKISFRIAILVDTERLLPQFSTAMAAVVCTTMAGHALGSEYLLRKGTMKEAEMCRQATRLCYNELWLKRERLRNVIIRRGGNPELLPLPVDARGKVDMVCYLKDAGHIVEFELPDRSHRVASGSKSPLSIVQNADTDLTLDTQSLEAEALFESDQDAEHSEWSDSWEDSDDDIEMFDIEVEKLEPLCRQ